jgi:hypothetical protein
MKFLVDRYEGQNFKEASLFEVMDKSVKGEKAIEKFKASIKDFGYIKV